MSSGLLSGVKVLDVGSFSVGPMAAGFLGILGADVIRIEPPQGDGLMYLGTPVGGVGSGYISSHYNKKNIILDLKSDKGKKIAAELIKWADILIENRELGVMDQLGMGWEVASRLNPGIIYVSAPPYGQTGPWCHRAGADPYLQAATGFASLTGREEGAAEILRYPVHLDTNATLVIVEAALLGLITRSQSGTGLKIETSHFQASLVLQTSRIAEFFASGTNPKRMGSGNSAIVPSQSFLTLDNQYINVSTPWEDQWSRLCKVLELENLEDDTRFVTNKERVKHREELIPLLQEKFLDKPAFWWARLLPKWGIPCGRLYTYEEIIRDPHVLANEMLVDLKTPWGTMKFSRMPLRFSEMPDLAMKPPVHPDQDRDEILNIVRSGSYSEYVSSMPFENPEGGGKAKPPLAGLRVLDLTEEIAGPFCSMQLGNAGAEVIKIEGLQGDWSRNVGPAIGGTSTLFLALNRNKKSIAVDLSSEAGRQIVYDLASHADILVQSFRPGVAEEFGFGYEEISKANPRIIYAAISPFGETGPYRSREASELEIQGMSGYMWFVGEPGESPVRIGADIAAINAGMWAFIGILAGQYYRARTGLGQKIEVSLLGTLLSAGSTWIATHSNPDIYAGWHITGPFDHAETGYRTKDEPIVFSLAKGGAQRGREAFQGFCKSLGLEALLSDPWFREHGARMVGIGRDAQENKPLFEEAFTDKRAEEIIGIIDAVGGMGSLLYSYELLFGEPPHPQVAALEVIQEIDHPTAGSIKMIAPPIRLRGTLLRVESPPPLLGQHTEEVLKVLAYKAERIERLRQEGIVIG